MAVDQKIVDGVAQALRALEVEPAHPVPTGALAALADIAEPGVQLRIDLEASVVIGAPLITLTKQSDDTALLEGLTPRQCQVARLVLSGKSNRQIASELGISLATVKDHVHAVLRRLDMPSRAALIAASRSVGSG